MHKLLYCSRFNSAGFVRYDRSMANSATEARGFRTPYSKVPCSGSVSVAQPDQMDYLIGCGVDEWLQSCCVRHTAHVSASSMCNAIHRV